MELDAKELIGREEELGSLEVFLAEALTGPAALVVSGEPGIGKTALLGAALAEARTRFPAVLHCRGAEAEAALGFAGLSELLTEILGEVSRSLPPPRRRALEVALLLAEPEDDSLQAHAVGLAILDVLRELEKRGPVLLAIDDLQWLDTSTAAALQIALRRVRNERIGVLATVREAEGVEVPLELERSFADGGLTQLALGPLGVGALHRLLKNRLGLQLARSDLVHVRDASGGNPLFALEFGRELVRSSAEFEPGKPLRVPDSLAKLLRVRLAELPPETVQILQIAAAAGDPTVETLAAADGSRERHPFRARSGRARRRGRGGQIGALRAPFVRVRLLRARHGGAATRGPPGPRRRDRRLGGARPPPGPCCRRAQRGRRRGARRGGHTRCWKRRARRRRRALELAVSPPLRDSAHRRRRRLRAAELHNLGGNPERAGRLYEELLGEVDAGVERADALFGLASTRSADASTFAQLLDEALGEAAGDDARSARILGFRAQVAFVYGGPGAGAVDARAAFAHAERAGDPLPLAVAIAHLGQLETYTLDVTPGSA